MAQEQRGAGRPWRVLVPITALAAGVLFATSAATAGGTDLRAGRFADLADLVDAASKRVTAQDKHAAALRHEVEQTRATAAQQSGTVAAEVAKGNALQGAAGLEPHSTRHWTSRRRVRP